VFDTETRQDEIFDWGVKNIVEGELDTTSIGTFASSADTITRCDDRFQRHIVLLWSDRFWKDIQ
jgi:hypothetical protein